MADAVAESTQLDPARQQKAKEYARIKRRFFIGELLFSAIYVLFWIFSGLSPWLRDQVHVITEVTWLSVPLFALGFGLPYALLTAPLNFYSGYLLPHRYEQSVQSFQDWLLDQIKAAMIAGLLGLVLLEIMYWLMGVAPQTWWLWTGGVMLIFTVLLANLAPVLIFPLFFKYKPLTNEELVNRLTQLAERAETKVQGVYGFDMSRKTVAANAALMGLGNTRRIILGDTLIDNFSVDEIETVLAHELGHHVHKDLTWGIIVQSALTLLGLWLADGVMRWGIAAFGYTGLTDPATFPLLIIAFTVFGLVTMPMDNAWSRWREVKADTYALQTTRNPDAFISAMTRLANQNLADADPPAWVEFLLHSHPSIQRRIQLARDFEASTSA